MGVDAAFIAIVIGIAAVLGLAQEGSNNGRTTATKQERLQPIHVHVRSTGRGGDSRTIVVPERRDEYDGEAAEILVD